MINEKQLYRQTQTTQSALDNIIGQSNLRRTWILYPNSKQLYRAIPPKSPLQITA